MVKNKIISILLVIAILLCTYLTFFVCAKADSPNLLEMYGHDPSFSKSLTSWSTLENAKIERYQDSSDKDGWCVKISERDSDYSVASLMGDAALSIFKQQGSGSYYYSFYVKCANPGEKVYIRPQFQLIYGGTYSADAMKSGDIIGKWYYGSSSNKDGLYVDSTAWTKIEMTVTVNKYEKNKSLGEAKLYASQTDFNGVDGVGGANAYDLLFDNFTLVKKGNWTYVNGTPVPTATPTPVAKPYPNETVDPNEGQILPMPTLTAAPNSTPAPTSSPKTNVTTDSEKVDKNKPTTWNFAMIAIDMFAWNSETDSEYGIEHYFDNTTRIVNWVLIAVVMLSVAAIVYALIPLKKRDEAIEIIEEIQQEAEE